MGEIILPNEYTLPPDLVNVGVQCVDCQNKKVVYHISVPGPGFPPGPYCYKCLLNRCRASHRIPLPMEAQMLDSLQTDLGILHSKKIFLPGLS